MNTQCSAGPATGWPHGNRRHGTRPVGGDPDHPRWALGQAPVRTGAYARQRRRRPPSGRAGDDGADLGLTHVQE